MPAKRVAVIGGGWAGLAAAVHATRQGHQVTLYEMAPQLGGRARRVEVDGLALDNGQHILIGAYTQTLALMRQVGVDTEDVLLRRPLSITYPDGPGLQLRAGSPLMAFARAVLRYPGWRWKEKSALLTTATGWALRGFQCDTQLTVSQLTTKLPTAVRRELLDPLCIAALNTDSTQASASVFLRVLKDALFSGPGSADLLLPRVDLSTLLPQQAAHWLADNGASIKLSLRVQELERHANQWLVDGEAADTVVVACTAPEAARLVMPHQHEWAQTASSLRYEPIITVYARGADSRLPQPMMALRSSQDAPAQFVFDLGTLRGMDGVLAFVISGAADWVDRGLESTTSAVLAQGQSALRNHVKQTLEAIHTSAEKRATFLCTPNLQRAPQQILPGLVAAGDYVIGPYPATLEGAVRSGNTAVRHMA
jgi:squalene-associated FAD-dependent desaturase